MTYANEFFANALRVAEAYPNEYRDFCEMAASRAIWGEDPVEIAAKMIARRNRGYDPLETPFSEDGHLTIRGVMRKHNL